jgi:peptidoglycan/LPS O-acetylase OafA/YrhL
VTMPPNDAARGTRFNSLTGMRSLAAVTVAVHHGTAVWPSISLFVVIGKYGYLGVDFFFCLSGFVMQWAWSRGTTGGEFLKRRFARLYPVIVLTLAVSFVAWWWVHSPLAGYVGGRHSIIYNLLVIQAWFFNTPDIRQSWNGVTWSLSCEMFFYACSPILLTWIAMLKARASLVLLAAAFALYSAAQLLTVPHGGLVAQNFFYFFPPGRIPEFIMGALACQILITGPRLRFRSVWVTFAVTVVVPLVIYNHVVAPNPQYLTLISLVVVPGFIMTIMVAAGRDMRRRVRRRNVLASRPMVWLGDVSYSYYMVHALVLGGLAMFLAHLHVATSSIWVGSMWIVIFLLLSLVAAWIVWLVVEHPGQRLLLQLLRKRSRAEQGAPARMWPKREGPSVAKPSLEA